MGFETDNEEEQGLVHKITSRIVDLQDNGFVSGDCQSSRREMLEESRIFACLEFKVLCVQGDCGLMPQANARQLPRPSGDLQFYTSFALYDSTVYSRIEYFRLYGPIGVHTNVSVPHTIQGNVFHMLL
jgi:hypothetical protein